MNVVAEVLEELMDAFTRDPDCVVHTGYEHAASALADVTEYTCHCVFNCSVRGSQLALKTHAIWGQALSRFYATKEVGASYSTAIFYAEHALSVILSSVEEFPSDIDRSRVPVLLGETVHSFIQMHVPDCESRYRLESLADRVKLCA